MSVAGSNTEDDLQGDVPHIGMSAAGASARPELGRADRRMVTVLFCDIVNSTQMVMPQDPEDAYDQLSGLINIMTSHIERVGGTVCQTLGDGVYAVFGAPVAQENHGVRACFAAEAILREVGRGQHAVRIGISSGEVLWNHSVNGNPAVSPAAGQAIHMAAKLQHSAPANGARVADGTARLVGDWVELRPAAELVMVGGEMTLAHDLLGLRRRRRQQDDALPMVGRGRLKDYLLSMLDDLCDGKGGLEAHLITGAAGLGKTRLMRVLAETARGRGVRTVEWQVPAVEAVGVPGPLPQLVAELLDGPLPRTMEGVASMVRAAGAAPEEADALARMLRPSAEKSKLAGAPAVLALAASGLAALARAAAARRPLLLLVEDAHWADTGVQAVLSALFDLPPNPRLLLIVSSREEGLAARLSGNPALRQHRLTPLGVADVSGLLDLWMGGDPALDVIKHDLARRARGNPFFLVECIRVLMMNGTLRGRLGEMRPGDAPAFALPDNVQTLLAARIDMLDEEARGLLRAAAVVGPTFDVVLLSAVLGGDVAQRRLPDLVRIGLIDETRLLPRQEYSFHHALLHESVYAGVTKRDRQRLHGHLAELLDRADFAELPGRLAAQARHAFAGCHWPLAARAGREAGREALSRSLATEAVTLFGIAVDANEKLPDDRDNLMEGIDLRLALARAAMPAGQGERAMAELDRAVMLARVVGDESRALAGIVQQINYEWVYGRLDQAITLVETALSYSGGADAAHPEMLIIAAACRLENNEPESTLRLLDRAERAQGTASHVPGLYLTLDTAMVVNIKRARSLAMLGRDVEAEPLIQSAIRSADASSFPFNRVFVRTDAAEIRLWQRRYGEVLAHSSEGLAISRSTGATLFDAVNLARRGLALVYLGRGSAGSADIEQGLSMANASGATLHSAKARLYRVLALALIGKANESQQELEGLEALVIERKYALLRRHLPTPGDIEEMVARSRPSLMQLSIR